MAGPARSTLSEANMKLAEVLFAIMNTLDSSRWQSSNQIIYSSVDEWLTAQEAFKVFNKTREVKFPFASLTRNPEPMHNHHPWSTNFIAYEGIEEGDTGIKTARIKDVRVNYNFTIYDNRLEDIETFSDLIIVDGRQSQRLDYFSEILNQNSRISFIMEEPTHNMIPDRDDKRDLKGFIFSITVPILLDTVLGLPGSQNLISEVVSNLGIIPPTCSKDPDDILDIETNTIKNEN